MRRPSLPREGCASGSGDRTPQAPSASPPPSQCPAHGTTTETPTADRDATELVDALTAEVHELRIARDSNRRIGMAIGIVMNHRHVDDQQAFDILRRTSQNTNRKLRNVAEDVIHDRHM